MLTLAACGQRPLYHHYEHVPISGWDRRDTIRFDIPVMKHDGDYSPQLGLRTVDGYPYRDLSIIVEHRITPSRKPKRDTLYCDIINKTGHPIGDGISVYQYLFPLPTLSLKKGEHLQFSVYHNMRRESMPDISSVGILLEECDTPLTTH